MPHRNRGEGHDPSLSPDGKLIGYTGILPEGGVSVFVMNHDASEKRRVVKAASKVGAAFPNWSPDGKWISFRKTDERYWSNKERMLKIYSEKPADKRPVWVIRPDGAGATLLEPLRFQMAIDGSRASWKP